MAFRWKPLPVRSEKEERKGESSSSSQKETLFSKSRLACQTGSSSGWILSSAGAGCFPRDLVFSVFRLFKWWFCKKARLYVELTCGHLAQHRVSSYGHYHSWLKGNCKDWATNGLWYNFLFHWISSLMNISWSSEALLYSLPFPNPKAL